VHRYNSTQYSRKQTRPTSHLRYGHVEVRGFELEVLGDQCGRLRSDSGEIISGNIKCAILKPGTHWQQSRQSPKPTTKSTVDFVTDTFDFVVGLSKVDCCRLVRLCQPCRGRQCRQRWTCSTGLTLSKVGNFCQPNVEHPFDFVTSMYRALTQSPLLTSANKH